MVRIVDESGNTVASYVYNAWGKSLPVNTNTDDDFVIASADIANAEIVANMNPLRYRGYYYDTETGFYYLQSRYYDPNLGRFINADALASTGQGILGNNMFAYCNNNPINGCDPCGTCFHRWDFWNDCDECVGKNWVRKIEAVLSKKSGTISQGITGSISLGFWTFGGQFGVSMDFKGNVEYQWAFYGGLTTGTPGGSLEIYHTVTSAPDVTKLRGMGYNIGASFAAGGALSVDGVIIPDTDLGKIYWGASVAGGIGGGADIHAVWGSAAPVGKLRFNIFAFLNKFFYNESR